MKLENRRSPIVYLLEAADDIAYSAADIEDGVKLGIVTTEDIKRIFAENLSENKDEVIKGFEDIQAKLSMEKNIDQSLIIQQFRIFTQKIMIREVINTFKENYDEIMVGKLQNEIIDISKAKDIRRSYKKLQGMIFNNKSILKKEIAGWEAIYGLLSIFVNATRSENFKSSGNNYESRLYNIISSSYRKVYEDIEKYPNQEYKKLQLVVDFITGMTDSYAINLYQELKG